mmetsp:Transcript_27009/g.55339  ORF Transcript_27009/g.55339 Transcript_27009/m.55339 type:complete len:80 (-) Transcript_27009:470-709(-)
MQSSVNLQLFDSILKLFFYFLSYYFWGVLNFNEKEPSQNLRSALEEKARKQPGAGQSKPKRKMKPGQAKTLSDLPQLSA